MKALLLSALLVLAFYVNAQKKYVGPSTNVGREYGNPRMPLMVSHLAGANKERLKRANKIPVTLFLEKYCAFVNCVGYNQDTPHR